MGTFSLGHWLVVLVVVLIVFGAGRLPKTMGELAKGVRAFRAGLKEENAESTAADDGAPVAPRDASPSPQLVGQAPAVGAAVAASRTDLRGE